MTDDTRTRTELIIKAVKGELALGTLHYNKAGKLLETLPEIVLCLHEEGGITVVPRADRQHLFKESKRNDPSN